MVKITISLVLIVFVVNCYGQPNYIYEGGPGGGVTSIQSDNVNPYFFEGAFGGGSNLAEVIAINAYFYKGDFGEGYAALSTNNVYPYFYEGGILSGYTSNKIAYQGVNFYEGDLGEGYTLATKCAEFIWTGTVGTGWSVPENWNYQLVPDINRPVIIPTGVPNYPNVNAGILAIGDNPNSGSFKCKSIWVQEDAMLITRINNFVENYGGILIDGSLRVKNSAANAFMNLEGGVIRVSPTGSIVIKP